MGNNSNANTLISGYVDQIPVLPSSVNNGEKASQYFNEKHHFTHASLFMNERFNRKHCEVAGTVSEKNHLDYLANLINMKAQRNFDNVQAK